MTPDTSFDSPAIILAHARHFQRLLRHDLAEAEYEVTRLESALERAKAVRDELLEDERDGQAYIDGLETQIETEADE